MYNNGLIPKEEYRSIIVSCSIVKSYSFCASSGYEFLKEYDLLSVFDVKSF